MYGWVYIIIIIIIQSWLKKYAVLLTFVFTPYTPSTECQ